MATVDHRERINGKSSRPAILSKAAWILLGLAFLAAIFMDAFFSDSGILQVWQLEREYKQLVKDIKKLEQENLELQRTIEELEARPDAIEDVAREELGFIKPGEEVYIFPQEISSEVTNPTDSSRSKQPDSPDEEQ